MGAGEVSFRVLQAWEVAAIMCSWRMGKSLEGQEVMALPRTEQEKLTRKLPLLEKAVSFSVGRIRKSVVSRTCKRERDMGPAWR